MVYLCWERAFTMAVNPPTDLIAVFGTEEEAREVCEKRASALADGSGLIAESITGDSWDVTNARRNRFAVGFNAVSFGLVDGL